MKVLHISHSDIYGGAAIAGFRLHQGLLGQGADSKMMVERVDLGGERITSIPKKAYWEARIAKPAQAMGLSYLPLISSFAIAQHPFYQAAEVLQLHNLHSGFFNYLALPKLTQHKPAVWTLHDMWALTGHCSYSYECDRWKSGCGQCPHPETYPAIKVDNTHLEWKLKSWVYGQSNLAIVAPSSWLVKQAQQSILNRFAIHHIPHGIDTSLYQPLDPQKCRHLLGIPTDKRHVLLFVAFSLKEARKGADLLIQALQGLPPAFKAETLVLTIGTGGEGLEQIIGIDTHNLGYISGDRMKTIAFSAADLFIFPTRADIFGLVLQESLACGTPMVSFKVGGVPDLVRHGVTGYLAEPENTQDLRRGIIELLADPAGLAQMRQTCRAIAAAEYPLELQAQRYLELYNSLR